MRPLRALVPIAALLAAPGCEGGPTAPRNVDPGSATIAVTGAESREFAATAQFWLQYLSPDEERDFTIALHNDELRTTLFLRGFVPGRPGPGTYGVGAGGGAGYSARLETRAGGTVHRIEAEEGSLTITASAAQRMEGRLTFRSGSGPQRVNVSAVFHALCTTADRDTRCD
jgi:hypothetical protein